MATFDYAPAPESRAVVDLQPSYGLFIGGESPMGLGRRIFIVEIFPGSCIVPRNGLPPCHSSKCRLP